MKNERYNVAVHEAGHVVCGMHLQGIAVGARITDSEGYYRVALPTTPDGMAPYLPRGITELAGCAAERLICGGVPSSAVHHDDESAKLSTDRSGVDLATMRITAEAIVAYRRAAVEAVAAELDKFGVVSGRRAHELAGIPAPAELPDDPEFIGANPEPTPSATHPGHVEPTDNATLIEQDRAEMERLRRWAIAEADRMNPAKRKKPGRKPKAQ